MGAPDSPEGPLYSVVHTTRHSFPAAVAGGAELTLRLAPRGAAAHRLVVRPLPERVVEGTDPLGNRWVRAVLVDPFESLLAAATSVAGPRDEPPPEDGATLDRLRAWSPRVADHGLFHDHARRYLGRPSAAAVAALTAAIGRDFTFDPAAGDPGAGLGRFLASRRGVCQDFAHFAIGCLRAGGLPACYAIGYVAAPAEGASCHAWALCHLPDEGWTALDPTHGRTGRLGHILLGLGRDHADVAPVAGVLRYSGDCRSSVSISVRRAPRTGA